MPIIVYAFYEYHRIAHRFRQGVDEALGQKPNY